MLSSRLQKRQHALLLMVCMAGGFHVGLGFLLNARFHDQPIDYLRVLSCPMDCRSEEEPLYAEIIIEPFEVPTELDPPQDAPEEEEEEDEAAEDAAEPPPEPPANAYSVDISSYNDEIPADSDYLAERDNVVEDEVVAEVTTLLEVEPGTETAEASQSDIPPAPDDLVEDILARLEEEEAASDDDTLTEPEPIDVEEITDDETDPDPIADREDPRENEAPSDVPDEPESGRIEEITALDAPQSSSPSGDVLALDLSMFSPSMTNYQQTFGGSDRRHRDRIARQISADGYLGGDDRLAFERERAALENMVPEVRFGTETHLNTRRSEYAAYLSYVHRRIHPRWGEGFLIGLDLRRGPFSELSDPTLTSILEIVIDRQGVIARVNVVRSSGQSVYDSEAIAIAYELGPLEAPPSVLRSSNGNTYIHWTFWRDQRQCGTFGASIHRVE